MESRQSLPISRKALQRRGPESLTWDQMKGKPVRITYLDHSVECAKLVWVDKYTIGIEHDRSFVEIVFKSAISKVSLT